MTTAERQGPPTPPALSSKRLFSMSAFWLGTNLLWGAWLMIIVPSQMKRLDPKNYAQSEGFLLGWGAIPAVVVPIIVGALSDRCRSRLGRRRPYILAGVLVNLVGLAIAYTAGAKALLWLYFIAYLVVQVGNNVATGAYSGVIPDIVPVEQHGEASGWMAAMSQIGTVAGAFSAGILMDRGMAGAAYVVIASSLAVSAAITIVGTPERPQPHVPPFDWHAFAKSLWIDPRRYPNFAWVWITRALVVMGLWTVQQYMQYYLSDRLAVSDPEREAGFILALGLICATVSGILGGRLSDRVGRKPVVYLANGTVAIVAILFVLIHSLPAAYILGAIFGLAYGAYYSVDWALGCDVLPNKELDAAKDMGIWHVAMVLPQSIALPIAGVVLERLGKTMVPNAAGIPTAHYSAAGYTAIFCLAAAYFVAGAVFLRNVRGVR
ncbi:MAG: MFS transporter [Chthonomonadales bacterium]